MTAAGPQKEINLTTDAETQDEALLVSALMAGSEAAFVQLMNKYNPSLLRLAMVYVHSKAVAEEVVQETWLGVLNGLRNFEGRSSLKTWLFRILTNQARTRARREARSTPFSDIEAGVENDDTEGFDLSRFSPDGGPQFSGHWVSIPRNWDELPEQRLLSKETREQIGNAIDKLSLAQKQVITLRDIEGIPAEEVSNILGITDTNQRVLLHRARTRVRQALENYLNGT